MIDNADFHAPLSPHGLPGTPIRGQDRSQVQHLCPECGGATAVDLGNVGLVQQCKYCYGTGLMTDQELSAYVRMLNDPHNPQGNK